MVMWAMTSVVYQVGAIISAEPAASIFRVEDNSSTMSTEARGCSSHSYQMTQYKKIQVTWDVTLCCGMSSYGYFEESQCLYPDDKGAMVFLYVGMLQFVRPVALLLVLLLA
jgi:hypothetical protein